MSADDRSRSPVNARLESGGNPSKKAVESAEFVATEMPVAQSNVDTAFSCSPSRDLHVLRVSFGPEPSRGELVFH
jgi:hypothetical protein